MSESAPFARSVRVESIPKEGLEQIIEASRAERAALAKRHGLPDIKRLTASFALRRVGGGVVQARGEVRAEVTQICVVSLEPFAVALDEPVDVRFAAPPREGASRRGPSTEAAAETFAPDDADPPDPIVEGKIDLGPLAVEFMLLGLDPYPRKPGVEFAPPASKELPDAPLAGLGEESKKS